MNLAKELQQINFTEKEAKVYLACLELGSATVQEITKKSQIKRTTVQRTLDSLRSRGYANVSLRKRRRYFTTESIFTIRKELEQRLERLSILEPRLNALTNALPSRPSLKLLDGEEGMKKVIFETASYKGNPVYCWYNYDSLEWYGEEFGRTYIEQRVKNKVYIYAITNRSQLAQKYRRHDQEELRQIRFYTDPALHFEVDIYLYGNRHVALINRKQLMVLVIEDREVFSMLKTIFLSNWEQLAP